MPEPTTNSLTNPGSLTETEALRLVSAVHQMPTGILILGPKGEIHYVNHRFDQITGLKLADRKQRLILDVCGSANRLLCEMLHEAVARRQPWQGELASEAESGRTGWVYLSISPVHSFEGALTHFAVVCEDVTATKTMLLEMKKSERRYRAIFESVGVAIWEQDFSAAREWIDHMKATGVTDFRAYFAEHPEMRIKVAGMVRVLDVNNYALKLFGATSKSQLLGSLDRQCRAETLEAIPGLIQAIADGDNYFEVETIADTAHGTKLNVMVGMALPPPDEPQEHVLVTILDISRRIRAEAEADRMRRFLFSIVDNIPLMVFVKDARDFRMVFWNKYSEELTGVSRHDLIGTTDFDHFPEEQARAFRADDERVVRERTLVDIPEEPISNSMGETRLLHTRKIVLTDDSGKPEYLLGIAEDITSKKAAERKRQELEREVTQSRQLEAVGSLAAGIAHEINTPIQFVGDNVRFLAESIDALLGMGPAIYKLVEGIDNTAIRDHLVSQLKEMEVTADIPYLLDELPSAIEQTLDGVRRVAEIVRAMKDFAPSAGKGHTAADINKMIESTLTVARNEYKYVADIVTNLDENLPPIECLQSELNQVWLNLIINAAHAIAAKGGDSDNRGTITVTTRQDGVSVIVEISDTGCGIPDNIRDRVWDHFFTTKEVGRGTGQGLTIVRSIIDRHHGTITFQSDRSTGTTFTVKLPLQRHEPAGIIDSDQEDLQEHKSC